MKKLVVLIAFLFLVGCSSGSSPFDESIDEVDSSGGSVIVNEKAYHMEPGGYRWERKTLSGTEVVMTDAASPNQIAESMEPIQVKKGETVSFQFEKEKANLTVYLWSETERLNEVELEDNTFHIPDETGYYIYEVVAQWRNGEVSYTFTCEVKD
ncbi:hypothetical protein ACWE42_21175 [Sutcliffiella cohnii]